MKTKTQFIVIFAAGLGLGALVYAGVTGLHKTPTDQPQNKGYNDNMVQGIMLQFQAKLSDLQKAGNPTDTAELSKQVELQSAILGLMTKYREAEFAKVVPFLSFAGGLVVAILGVLAPKLIPKRSSETNHTP